jgi:poly-gamma-glutamate synthesis protein (capsule biosynthesis protein)
MTYAAESGDFDLAMGGDFMLTQRVSVYQEPDYLAIVEALRAADAAFVNLETVVRRWDEGSPSITAGTPMTTLPHLLDEIKWMGINIVSSANNHVYDYGENGVRAMLRHLQDIGLAHAGCGHNLAESRMPAYVETPRGRLGLVAMTSTFRPWNVASPSRGDVQGRPGINPLRHKVTYTVDAPTFEALQKMNVELGFLKEQERAKTHFYSDKEIAQHSAEQATVFGQKIVKGDSFDVSTAADIADLEDNLRWIREARRQADWVLVSIHTHEFNARSMKQEAQKVNLSELADFFQEMAYAAIDAGADAVVGHGSHTALGIELYKGKPIFYSLGGLLFQNETVSFVPSESYDRFDLPLSATPADLFDARTSNEKKGFPAYAGYWECFVPICRYRNGALAEIEILPTDLGFGKPRYQRGRAVQARGDLADKIISRLQQLSAPFGTEIANRNGVGFISLS